MMQPAALWQLILHTLRDPVGAAEVVLSLNLGRVVLWQALLLVCVLSALLMGSFGGEEMIIPMGNNTLFLTPIGYAFVLGAGLVLMVFAIHFTGGALDGAGRFEDALAAIVWLEVLALVFRVAQIAIALVFGGEIAAFLSFLGVIVLLWTLINFINVVHRFDSIGKALGVLVLSVLGISIGMSMIIAFIGVGTGLTLPTGA